MRNPARIAAACAVAISVCASAAPANVDVRNVFPPASAPGDLARQGIVTFRSRHEMRTRLGAVRRLGVRTQAMKRLPMAIVTGSPRQLARTAGHGRARRFFPDERLQFHSDRSNHAIGVDAAHALGYTGRGVRIAVIDTGIDATNPYLAGRVVHNVKVLGPQYAEQPADSPPGPIFVHADKGPYSNTDLDGHGTLVASVAAARPTGVPGPAGVAPDAELIGYSIGESGFTNVMTAVSAMDHILDHPEWGIDVVNNSYGSGRLTLFDPADPINMATKALTDRGVAVVFSAGNRGEGDLEATLGTYGAAPWAIAAGASSVSGSRADFSSNGLMADNARAIAPVDGHVRFTGDRLGIYHPSVTAPGVDLEVCPPLGGPPLNCQPAAQQSGTSYAAPHVTGVVALLRQARPGLTVADAKATLEATARPLKDDRPLWQNGYGIVDARAALGLVRRPNFRQALRKAHALADARELARRDWKVQSSDLWRWDQPSVDVGGVSPRLAGTLPVSASTDALRVNLVTHDPLGTAGYTAVVRDAAGDEIGRTESTTSGPFQFARLHVDLRSRKVAFGDWSVAIDRWATVNDTPGKPVTQIFVHAALLEKQVPVAPSPAPGPRFVADGRLALAFTPDPAQATGARSAEGCDLEADPPRGSLAPAPPVGSCHAWTFKPFRGPAQFTSAPLEKPLVLGGSTRFVLRSSPLLPYDDGRDGFEYELAAVTPRGETHQLDADLVFDDEPSRHEFSFDLDPVTVPAGHRLRFAFETWTADATSKLYLVGGPAYGDAGITLTTGHFTTAPGA